MKISTGTKTLDELLLGGIRTKVPTILFGIPNLGKSWFCFQMSAMATRPVKVGGLNKKVLYLDTESFFFDEEVEERFKGFFRNRWKDAKVENIEVVQVPSLFDLGEWFGIEFELVQEEKRTSVIAKFPTERQKKLAKAAGKSKVTSTQKSKDWLEKSKLYPKLATREYGLVIIDSLTVPIKSEIVTSTQNFPARTSVLRMLLGASYPLAQRSME